MERKLRKKCKDAFAFLINQKFKHYKMSEKNYNETVVSNLVDLLTKSNAHVTLDDALQDIPFDVLSKKPKELPYNIWQLAQHIRIAQEDILKFSQNPLYQSPPWPEGYWPKETGPASPEEWNSCLEQIKSDRASFIELLKNAGDQLYTRFENANGQTLLREALVLADHNSYHTGEIVMLRRLLNEWK